MKDYYSILGVDKNASQDEIKKAFRKLSLKWHPDRQQGKSEEEKKAAEEKFKEISEAYETLSDKDKRAAYDNPGFGGAGNPFNDFSSMFRGDPFFGDIFANHSAGGTMHFVQPGKDIVIPLTITLEDLYLRPIKEIKYTRKVRCKHCHGLGGDKVEDCPRCHGTGMITNIQRQGNMTFQTSSPCPNCGGTGKIVFGRCEHCHGTGFEEEEATQKVDLSQIPLTYLIKDGVMLYVGNFGDDSRDEKGNPGKLQLRISLQYDRSKYIINGWNIQQKIYVDVDKMLLGGEIKFTMPSKKIMKVKIKECQQDGSILKIAGKGLTGFDSFGENKMTGDYYIELHTKIPETLTDKQKKAIKEYQNN